MQELQKGDIVDNFQVVEQLHKSAVASLYRADDLLYDISVVLKVPLDDIVNNPVLLYHHQNESRIQTKLDHPAIVRHLPRYTSSQYLVMEYIEGKDLRTLLNRQKKLPISAAIDIFCQTAAGLAYLHNQNVLHLDLKPENVMIGVDNLVKIIDFGLSRQLHIYDELGADFTGAKGTPYYIAPEQLCGFRATGKSDIYSLAILLYEMLTGKLPFDKSKALSKVKERLKLDPVPPRYYDASIPPSLQDTILRCLKRNPEDRVCSAEELIAEVENHEQRPAGQYGDLVTKPQKLLSYFSFPTSQYFDPASISPVVPESDSRILLGCLADHDNSDSVVDYLYHHALLTGDNVTLLHVLEEGADNEYEQFADEMRGAALFARFDRYLTELSIAGIPTWLKIKRGDGAEIIAETAREISADLIVIGRPREKRLLAKIFAGSVMEKIVATGLQNVVIAQTQKQNTFPELPQTRVLTRSQYCELDLFLQTSLAEYIKFTTLLCRSHFQKASQPIEKAESPRRLAGWLNNFRNCPAIEGVYDKLHETVAILEDSLQTLGYAVQQDDRELIKITYTRDIIPQLAELQQQMHRTLGKLRNTLTTVQVSLP